MKQELENSHPRLKRMAEVFEQLSAAYLIVPTITNVWEGSAGDSGVHEARRAIDFRDEWIGAKGQSFRVYTDEQVDQICREMNRRFPRSDKKLTVIHHQVKGSTAHFHVQMELNPLPEVLH